MGIPARAERYGTWMGWRRGIAHIDLIAPRIRPLEGMLSTYSPGTKGPVEGPVVLFPKVQSAAEFEAALPQVRGKFVLFSFPWPTCRPDTDWKEFATPESYERMQKERAAAFEAWYTGRIRKSGRRGRALVRSLEEAGALGIVTLLVPPPGPQGWGVSKISSTIAEKIPEVGLGCEDYGLVFRPAENNQAPILRVNADAEFTGEVPVSNVIAELRGKERPACIQKVRERFVPELERIAEESLSKPNNGTQWMEFQVDDDSHSPVVLFHYPSNEVTGFEYLRRSVKIEFGSLTD